MNRATWIGERDRKLHLGKWHTHCYLRNESIKRPNPSQETLQMSVSPLNTRIHWKRNTFLPPLLASSASCRCKSQFLPLFISSFSSTFLIAQSWKWIASGFADAGASHVDESCLCLTCASRVPYMYLACALHVPRVYLSCASCVSCKPLS